MKVLLISPVKNPGIKKPKGIMMPQLALSLLEGLTPDEYEVTTIEEEVDKIDLDADCDLVGLSCMTSNAPRAYYLADEFKKRGKTVVMGGVHPTVRPEEALRHADSVVIGEAEDVWENLLNDFKHGNLKKRYHKPNPSLDRYVHVKQKRGNRKRLFHIVPVMTTRGCPYNCEFCSVHIINGRKIRHVPIENVVKYIEESEHNKFMFLDDNIIGDPKYAKELFKAIKPLGIKWVGQASISFVKETEMMRLAVESGCSGLFFGLETVSKSQLKKLRKSIKSIEGIEEAIKKVRDMGIHFHASMVFGFDDDTMDIFPETLDFLSRNRVSTASFNVLTPYPGTATYKMLKDEDRIITEDWKLYDHNNVVFKPKNMTPLELEIGRLWAVSEFTKLSETMKRLFYNLSHPLIHLAVNMGSKKSINNEIINFPNIASEVYTEEWEKAKREAGSGIEKIRPMDIIPGKLKKQIII